MARVKGRQECWWRKARVKGRVRWCVWKEGLMEGEKGRRKRVVVKGTLNSQLSTLNCWLG